MREFQVNFELVIVSNWRFKGLLGLKQGGIFMYFIDFLGHLANFYPFLIKIFLPVALGRRPLQISVLQIVIQFISVWSMEKSFKIELGFIKKSVLYR